jgi:hypothetical protein
MTPSTGLNLSLPEVLNKKSNLETYYLVVIHKDY